MKNELAFASRQAENDGVSVQGSGGSFHYFTCWGGSALGRGLKKPREASSSWN